MPPDATREKLMGAAIREFEERGFEGARVDRIARKARANKAMIYYHFGDKRALYQAVLLTLFAPVRERIEALEGSSLEPRARLQEFYRGIVRLLATAPTLSSLMVREVLDGGEHLDRGTAAVLSEIVGFVRRNVEAGVRSGSVRPVNPLFLHLTMIAPILFYFMGGGFRRKVLPQVAPGNAQPTHEDLARHVDETLARSLDTAPTKELR
ncbi:MAG TPA: TetR/AcrR family transcriptional regulator [Vicinamibacteria bacterium]|nr:TetR/AcrR family transcriptional regulator [Vicinamibacteria bacterium]